MTLQGLFRNFLRWLFLKSPDLAVHGHVLSILELEVLSAAGIDTAVGMDGCAVCQHDIFLNATGVAIVSFQ